MYNKKTVIATKEDAEEVLHNGFAYDDTIYGMAVDFLQQNFPESRALSQLARDEDGYVDMRVSQYNAARMYETRVQASGGAADEDLSAAANQYIQEFEARSDMAEDGAAIDIDEDIDPISADDSFDELLGSLQEFEEGDAWRDVVKDVIDRTEFYYTSEDEKSKDEAETIWETVKTKILVNRTLNPEWQAVMRKGGLEKEEWLQEEIKNVYTAEVVTQAGATKIKKPTKEQQQLGSQEHADYIAGVAKTAQETFDRYARKNKKFEISSTMVVAGAGNAWAKLKGFIDFSEAKQLGENFIGKVKGYRDSFDDKMQQRHPRLWGWAKNIAEKAKASKWQTITGLVATGAVVLSGADPRMLTAYAAYMGVSSWIWPIANKKALELNRAKKSGNEETIALWKGGEGWERAITSILSNKREIKNYILKGTIGTVFAGVAGYLANHTELAASLLGNSEAMEKASDVTKGIIIRTQQAIIRSVGAVTGQFSTWLGDGISYLRDKTEENKAYFKQSSIGLGLSALLAGGATWWQLHNLHGLENTAVAEGLAVGNAAPKDLPEGAKLLAETDKGGRAYQLGNRVVFEENGKVAHNIGKSAFDNYKGDASDKNGAAKLLAYYEAKQAEVAEKAAAAAANSYTFKLADLAYTDEATDGLSADKWDNTMKILLDLPYGKETPKLDIEALTEDQKDVLREIMEHAHRAMKEHPEAFEGLTDKQAIFAAVQISSWQGVGTEVKGNIIRNIGEVIFKTGDAGKDAAYTAFVKMILCGEPTNLPDGVLNDTAKLIQPDGSMTGVVGKNLVRFKFDVCGEQVWIIDGHKVVKKVVKQISEQPTGTDEPKAPEVVQIEQPTGTTEGTKEFIQQKEQVLYVKTTTNITDGHYGQTSEYNKDGGVVKFVAGKSNDGM